MLKGLISHLHHQFIRYTISLGAAISYPLGKDLYSRKKESLQIEMVLEP